MRHFVSYIETNSVDIKLPYPVLTDFTEILYHLFIVCIQLWHPVCKCKGIDPSVSGVSPFLNLFPVLYHKPVRITRLFSMLQDIYPRLKFSSTMIKHCIYHNADSFFMCFFAKRFHCIRIAKKRIYFCIIGRVIFVVGLCFHDRIQINTGNPKFLQIR